MVKFAYNNAKNASSGYTLFKLNCVYHFGVSFEEDPNLRFWSKTANKVSLEIQKLMTVYHKNQHYA